MSLWKLIKEIQMQQMREEVKVREMSGKLQKELLPPLLDRVQSHLTIDPKMPDVEIEHK